MMTEATMPTVAAVIARDCMSPFPYLEKASPIAAAVPCPPQNPAGIERPKAVSTGQMARRKKMPMAAPNPHCRSIPAWE